MSTAEQIIAEHRLTGDPREEAMRCSALDCDWSANDAVLGMDAVVQLHAAHVVAALTNAGKTIVDQDAAVEALLETRPGLLLAHNSWNEGLSAGIAACNATGSVRDGEQPWRKPESPYFAPWAAARVAEGGDQP